MGWLARAPSEGQCATGHRYLRSPVEPNLYLGGPISLANRDDVSRISINMPFNKTSSSRGLVTVFKLRTLPPGSELLWSYSCRSTSNATFSMHSYDEWFKQVRISIHFFTGGIDLNFTDIFVLPWPYCSAAVRRQCRIPYLEMNCMLKRSPHLPHHHLNKHDNLQQRRVSGKLVASDH